MRFHHYRHGLCTKPIYKPQEGQMDVGFCVDLNIRENILSLEFSHHPGQICAAIVYDVFMCVYSRCGVLIVASPYL